MKGVPLIVGIISLIACALSLLFSAFNWFAYRHVLDGTAALFNRLRRRVIIFFVIGIVLALIGVVSFIVCSKILIPIFQTQ